MPRSYLFYIIKYIFNMPTLIYHKHIWCWIHLWGAKGYFPLYFHEWEFICCLFSLIHFTLCLTRRHVIESVRWMWPQDRWRNAMLIVYSYPLTSRHDCKLTTSAKHCRWSVVMSTLAWSSSQNLISNGKSEQLTTPVRNEVDGNVSSVHWYTAFKNWIYSFSVLRTIYSCV